MNQRHGKPNEPRTEIDYWYTWGQRFDYFDEELEREMQTTTPSDEMLLAAGLIPEVLLALGDNEKQGDMITPIADDKITYKIVAAQTQEELRAWMVVTKWQLVKALNQTGKRDAILAAIAQADQDTRDGWEYATQFERLHPLVVGLGAALGWSDLEVDDLFKLAATL